MRSLSPVYRLYGGLGPNGSSLSPFHRYVGLHKHFSTPSGNNSDLTQGPHNNSEEKIQRVIAKSKLLRRLNQNPKFSRYFFKLSEAGITSTVTSFLIMHELTAIAPLFGLWWVFYELDLPDQYELPLYFTNLLNQCGDAMERLVGDKYSEGFDRNRLILSGAISYAIVKFLYPLRVLFSLWAAPYMGKWLLAPFYKITSILKRKDKTKLHKK